MKSTINIKSLYGKNISFEYDTELSLIEFLQYLTVYHDIKFTRDILIHGGKNIAFDFSNTDFAQSLSSFCNDNFTFLHMLSLGVAPIHAAIVKLRVQKTFNQYIETFNPNNINQNVEFHSLYINAINHFNNLLTFYKDDCKTVNEEDPVSLESDKSNWTKMFWTENNKFFWTHKENIINIIANNNGRFVSPYTNTPVLDDQYVLDFRDLVARAY